MMASFFIQDPDKALRHVNLLAKGLKKVAIAGWVAGLSSTVLALLLNRFVVTPGPQASATPGFRELSGIAFVAWSLAIALLGFSTLYFVSGWGLAHQKNWGRYAAAGTFVLKVLFCLWLGRATLSATLVFLFISSCDIYGLWVLLSKETGQLFSVPQPNQAQIKPANLVS
jgi:hypothetical protein